MNRDHFIEPVDALFLRGNRPFGDPGSYGASLVPPWPSVAAGALRSHIYATTGEIPADVGAFRLLDFQLARQNATGDPEPLYPMPADLSVSADAGSWHVHRLQPLALPQGVDGSAALAKSPLLAVDEQDKPEAGLWLDKTGWEQYLEGRLPQAEYIHRSSELWEVDERVGVGLDHATRRADDGKLFSTQAICFQQGTGFLTVSTGSAEPEAPATLRFGGDGRGARLHAANPAWPRQPDAESLLRSGRARLILTSPGLFAEGWRLPGMASDGQWALYGARGRIVAAAVTGHRVVSGWDMVARQPKPAERVVPTGSLYWIEDLQGEPEALRKLAEHGLWGPDEDNHARRPEGYNRFHFGAVEV